MKAILFASTGPEQAKEAWEVVRRQWPQHEWSLCSKRGEDHWFAEKALRPTLETWRSLRAERPDVAVACWNRRSGYERLQLLHWLSGAKELHAIDENLQLHRVSAELVERHTRGLRAVMPLVLTRLVVWIYRHTLGAVIGLTILAGRHALHALRRRPC
jgi:hypothetical protein